VTFEKDDEHFYVTMGSAGHTWLMLGDLATKTLHSVIMNVECPSLSPDGTHIVFKKRISTSLASPWRLYVLDLKTLRETPLAETRSIDDQAAWLGDDEVMYQVPQTSGPGYDIWEVPADGSGAPKLLIHNGFSPVAVSGQGN
jgi:Tol biopolymer transport system component